MRLISQKELQARVGDIGTTFAYQLEKTDPRFPRAVKLGAKKTFVEDEVNSYITALIKERDGAGASMED